MQKKSVLGTDPFKWLKENDKKEDTANLKGDIDSQEVQTEKPLDPVSDNKETGTKYEEKQEEKAYEPIDVSETLSLQGNKIRELGSVIESSDKQDEDAFGIGDVTEANRKVVLGKDTYDYHAKPHETTHKESPATTFVIVYTVLLLILGFIVYKDLTKQIDRLETKLEIVEKQLNAGLINYEDTKVDDVW